MFHNSLIPTALRTSALALCLALYAAGASAQTVISPSLNLSDTTQIHQLETQRGDRFLGRVTNLSGTQIDFLMQANGELISFPLADVAFIGLMSERRNAVRRSQSAGLSFIGGEELFYSSSGFVPEGRGLYRNSLLVYNTVDFRLGKYASLGGGFVVPFVFIFKGKVSIPIKPFLQVGLASNNYVLLVDNSAPASQLQAIVTVGERERYITFGSGYIFDPGNSERYPIFSMGGAYVFNERNRIFAELGYYYDQFESFFLPTIQYSLMRRRNRFDLGLIGIPSDILIPFPVASYYRMF